jgi:hypothetical protein
MVMLRLPTKPDTRKTIDTQAHTGPASWNWSPALVGFHPRITSRGMEPATLYEISLPPDTPAVVDDRLIRGDLAERQKTAVEVEALRKYMGWDK